ncbi:class I adenylate-forming enzyme family protein [Phycicoccus sp.]|uniref:class I adenylate-forming enzyme family protein n=1 Tax=Phycicoccus sp. TaxID=1902410 RepID=UPI00345E800F
MAPKVRSLHDAAKVADYQARGWFSTETVDQLFRDRVAEDPDALALVDAANKEALVGTPARRLTWGELASEVDALTARLAELGLTRGDILATQMPNTVELVEVYLAAWQLGVVVSPLAVQYREHELTGMARQAEFAAYLTSGRCGDRDLLVEALAVRDRLPSVRTFIRYAAPQETSAVPDGAVGLTAAPATDADRDAVAALMATTNDPNDAMTICWTSGTEAEPKGVPRTHLEWLAASWAGVDMPRITKDDVILNPFPMINMAAFVGLLLPWLRTGCVLVQHHPFDLMVFLGQIAKERVTYTVAPPALLVMLLHNEALMSQVDMSSVTRLGSGSAPLPPSMVAGWQEKHGIGVINFFGSNEGIALMSSPEDFPDPTTRARYFPYYAAPGRTWSSRVSEWIQLRLVDLATGEDITEPGIVGELRIDGPTVFPGYIGGESMPSPFDERGYLKSGDLFEIAGDEGQYLLYVDRAKDLIIRGGMNIAPAEVEGLIAGHPAVAEVAVFGVPDEVLGERVAAVVSLKPEQSLDLDGLGEFLREKQVAHYKFPERLEVVPALPRNPVGKVLKRDLRATMN